MTGPDESLRRILTSVKTVSMLGVLAHPSGPGHFVARYPGLRGFRVIPVTPGHAGERLFGALKIAEFATGTISSRR